jgi:hypothetical protein
MRMIRFLIGLFISMTVTAGVEFDQITTTPSEAKLIFRKADGSHHTCQAFCVLEIKDDKGVRFSVRLEEAGNALNTDIETFKVDRSYRLTLIDQPSGLRSSSVEFKRLSEDGTFYYR